MHRLAPRQFRLFCFIAFSAAIFLPLSGFGQTGKNLLWRVVGKQSTVYILGSIHLLKKDAYPLSRTIETAFERADYLAVEANVNDVSSLDLGRLLDKALYQGNDTIADHLSKDAYSVLKKQAARVGLPLQIIEKQKPWLLALTVPSMVLLGAGYAPEYGIDKYFLTKAAGKKEILELESLNYQIELLAGLSDNEQELLLLYELKDMEVLTREVDKMVRAWQSGDARTINDLQSRTYTDNRRFYPVYERLVLSRNIRMTEKIADYLQRNGTCFVIVGAGHVVGEKGIIQLLRNRGFAVEQL